MKHSIDKLSRVILDSIADGVFTVDGDWKITYFNSAAERITGIPREEALGRQCCDVFRASICEAECSLRKTLQTGKPVVDEAIYIVDANGERIPISISTAILKDENGEVGGGVETFRDLSLVEELRKELTGKRAFGDIIGKSPAMMRVFDILPEIAQSDCTVLIEGESGTGKELVARALHDMGRRRDGPLISVNCGALPDALLASELFGHVAGAFTDARTDRPGRFARAEGGTLLLDEIGDISQAMQVQLLRVLQEKEYEPLGGRETVKADVRVIAATHRDLGALVEEGVFRRDLYYRINVVRVPLPPLRDRREDIPFLVEYFIAKYNRLNDAEIEGVSDQVVALLMRHAFPGNVRELENLIEHAFVLCHGRRIQLQHLPASVLNIGASLPADAAPDSLAEMEKRRILDVLARHHGNRAAAARELGIHKTTLWRRLKKYEPI